MDDAKHRIVFAGGGTGGHLFPGLAVADELAGRDVGTTIDFVGARRGVEAELVPRAGYPLRLLPLRGIKGMGAIGKILAVVAAIFSVLRCLGWWLPSRPELVIGVGGYASGPAVLAARILRVKTMVLEQNHFPGATNAWLAPRVDLVCVPSEAAAKRLTGKILVTGNPVRAAFAEIGEPPGAERLSLLVFGGSRGARSINRAMALALPELAALDPAPRIVHQCGKHDEDEVRRAYDGYPGQSEVHTFIDDMPARLADADLVICRAGATTLAELAAAGRPAILVPYPHAADDHQRFNAEAVEQAGAAMVMLDHELSGSALATGVACLAGDANRRQQMGRAARGLARTDAAKRIADAAIGLMTGKEATSHVS